MDVNPQTTQQPISDDQALAKALAGVAQETETPEVLKFEETPVPGSTAPASKPADLSSPATSATPAPFSPVTPATPATLPTPSLSPAGASDDLQGIKKDALTELRPLIDKVELPAEEKFDTYLMLIRNTDDKSLVGPAHAAAQSITDEKRKAQALLDIIKEIDYLSSPPSPTA